MPRARDALPPPRAGARRLRPRRSRRRRRRSWWSGRPMPRAILIVGCRRIRTPPKVRRCRRQHAWPYRDASGPLHLPGTSSGWARGGDPARLLGSRFRLSRPNRSAALAALDRDLARARTRPPAIGELAGVPAPWTGTISPRPIRGDPARSDRPPDLPARICRGQLWQRTCLALLLLRGLWRRAHRERQADPLSTSAGRRAADRRA